MPGLPRYLRAMHRHVFFLAIGLAPALPSCRTVRSIDRASMEWDRSGLWQQVAGSPTCQVPKGMPPRLPDASRGEWVVDPQDGWRFFVPHAGAGGLSRNVIRAEALKAVNKYSRARQRARNAGSVALLPVKILTPGLWDRSGSGSGGSGDFSSASDDWFTGSRHSKCKPDRDHSGHSHHHDHPRPESPHGGHHGGAEHGTCPPPAKSDAPPTPTSEGEPAT